MPYCRKKPIVLEFMHLSNLSYVKILEALQFLGQEDIVVSSYSDEYVNLIQDRGGLIIPTLEGDMLAKPGDYIIKGIKGEFYPCKPDIFALTYKVVNHEEM